MSKGNLLQVLVAEDLYDRLGESADILKRATYKAAKRWAGQEEVCRMRAMSFLYDACPSARFFMQVSPDLSTLKCLSLRNKYVEHSTAPCHTRCINSLLFLLCTQSYDKCARLCFSSGPVCTQSVIL